MPSSRLPIHGRDHRPGGIDPIPVVAAAASSGLPFAIVSATGSLTVGASPTTTAPNLSGFDTNDTGTFEQDSSSPFGILIKADGRFLAWAVTRFLDPAGGAVEPQTSWMSCLQSSSNYNGSQSDWRAVAAYAQGVPLVPGGAGFSWNPWDTDEQDIGAAFVGPPYSEYHVELFNAGTQTMGYTTALKVIRLGDSSGL